MPTRSTRQALGQYTEAKQRGVARHAGRSKKQSMGLMLVAWWEQLVPLEDSRNIRPEGEKKEVGPGKQQHSTAPEKAALYTKLGQVGLDRLRLEE